MPKYKHVKWTDEVKAAFHAMTNPMNQSAGKEYLDQVEKDKEQAETQRKRAEAAARYKKTGK